MELNPSSFWALLLFVASAASLNRVVVHCIALDPCQSMAIAPPLETLKFATNFEYLEGEYYFHGALGKGFDALYPNLTFGGPPPIGAQIVNLEPPVRRIIEEFGYEEVGQLRSIIEATGSGGIRRPLLNLSKEAFAEIFDKAVGFKLDPPFDPYANTANFLLGTSMFPYLGQVALVEAAPALPLLQYRRTAAAVLAMEAGQSSVIRTLLYLRANETVFPYNLTVAEFTNRTAALANRLGRCGLKNEGVVVPPSLGAESRTETNVLPGNDNSLSYARTVQEILGILYGTGDERKPGGAFPECANGLIPRLLGCTAIANN